MTVAIRHSFRVCHGDGSQTLALTWIDRVFNGNAAVTLFFVLSGYVLGLSLRNGSAFTARSMGAFGIRRFFRIYPVFLLSTLVVLGCLWCSARFGWPFPAWFGSAQGYHSGVLHPGTPPDAATVIFNLLMWSPSLNLVTWTLGIELRCSVLLPLLHWWSGKLSLRGRSLLLLGLVFTACLPKWCLLLGSARAETVVSIFHGAFSGYLFLFYLGYLLPEFGPAVFNKINETPAHWLLPWAPLVIFLGADQWGDELRILQGAAAAVIIGHLLYGTEHRVHRWLDAPVARFYGRISYSFYLWHDLVLIVLARTLAHFVPKSILAPGALAFGGVVLLASLAIATGIAALCFRWVERPFVGWSKRITAPHGKRSDIAAIAASDASPLPAEQKSPPPAKAA
jgi:peptidoglycan/LPS O-acetylase OafA/YrhL